MVSRYSYSLLLLIIYRLILRNPIELVFFEEWFPAHSQVLCSCVTRKQGMMVDILKLYYN